MAYILITIGVYLAWWRQTTTWNLSSTSTRMLVAFVLTVWQITALMVLSGLITWLNYWVILEVNCLLIVILTIISLGLKECGHLIPEIGIIRDRVLHSWRNHFVAAVMLIGIAVVGMAVWLAMTFPPMGYDYYHHVKAVLMVQEGHIQPFDWTGRGVDYYPANAEVIFAYVLLGTRNDSLVCLVQGVFTLFWGLAVYRTCRNFGVRVEFSAVAGLLLWSSTTVFHESWMALNDICTAGMIGIGWCLLTERRLGWTPVLLSALAFGWCLGAKASTVYWLIGATIYLTWRLITDARS